jgi:hypothetical protein
MVTQLTPGEDDHSAIMACIGFVCVQWALLENNLLGILANTERVTIPQAAILFGSLDMKPRLNMAINLATFHKWKPPLLKRLRNLRSDIDMAKLIDRRNLLVHGVHKDSAKPQHFILYTPRRSGTAQEEEWSILMAYDLGNEIQKMALEAWAILQDHASWAGSEHGAEHGSSQLVATQTGILARLKQYVRSRRDHRERRK